MFRTSSSSDCSKHTPSIPIFTTPDIEHSHKRLVREEHVSIEISGLNGAEEAILHSAKSNHIDEVTIRVDPTVSVAFIDSVDISNVCDSLVQLDIPAIWLIAGKLSEIHNRFCCVEHIASMDSRIGIHIASWLLGLRVSNKRKSASHG